MWGDITDASVADSLKNEVIGGYDDVLDFRIGQAIDVDVTR